MASESVQVLGTEVGYPFFSKALEASTEAWAVHEELTRQGLAPQPERTHLFNTFSRDSPFTTRDQTREGGGLSVPRVATQRMGCFLAPDAFQRLGLR